MCSRPRLRNNASRLKWYRDEKSQHRADSSRRLLRDASEATAAPSRRDTNDGSHGILSLPPLLWLASHVVGPPRVRAWPFGRTAEKGWDHSVRFSRPAWHRRGGS